MKKEILLLTLLTLLYSIQLTSAIEIELSWDKRDIYYGKDLDIKINIYNLQNQTYDLKVWIQSKENKTVLTEVYDSKKDNWKSGNYYINNFSKNPGNFSEDVELRIKEKHKDYLGKAYLHAKLRDSIEIEEEIKIIKPKEDKPTLEQTKSESNNKLRNKQNRNKHLENQPSQTIFLSKPISNINNNTQQQKTIKTQNSIIYQSKNELIKNYSMFSFALLCVILLILISWNKIG